MTPGWIHVYLLSENRLLREALTRYINKKNNIRVVGASAFSTLAIDQIIAAEPDILLSDSADHALSELQVIPEVLKAIPGLNVVMFGMENERHTFLRSVQQGVRGYVLKDASTAEVLEVVRAVADNEAVCPPSLQRSL